MILAARFGFWKINCSKATSLTSQRMYHVLHRCTSVRIIGNFSSISFCDYSSWKPWLTHQLCCQLSEINGCSRKFFVHVRLPSIVLSWLLQSLLFLQTLSDVILFGVVLWRKEIRKEVSKMACFFIHGEKVLSVTIGVVFKMERRFPVISSRFSAKLYGCLFQETRKSLKNIRFNLSTSQLIVDV